MAPPAVNSSTLHSAAPTIPREFKDQQEHASPDEPNNFDASFPTDSRLPSVANRKLVSRVAAIEPASLRATRINARLDVVTVGV